MSILGCNTESPGLHGGGFSFCSGPAERTRTSAFLNLVITLRIRLVYLVAMILLVCASNLGAETRMKLSDLSPGTESTTLVENGGFASEDSGWIAVTANVVVGTAPDNVPVPSSAHNALAQAYIDHDQVLGQYRRKVTLQGDTDYVLSAYMWELGDFDHHVDVIVVDLGDAGHDISEGIWEGQLTLYPGDPDDDKGYFIFDTFTTPPGEQDVTLRLFYTGLSETDDDWPSYPVGAMWDNVAITRADLFSPPLPYEADSGNSLDGDLDDDRDVDYKDMKMLSSDWVCRNSSTVADIDENNKVDFVDYARLAANWGVDLNRRSTLHGKIMCGYQGWFNCPGDGAGRGWVHWGKSGRFEPGKCSVDLWPDMSEYDADEKFATVFQHADGSTAHVFSSYNEKTVLRHFSWMEQYGIDGVFLQRFATETAPGSSARRHRDKVMLNCRKGANRYDRVWAMMYDISGLGRGGTQKVIDDWKYLVDVHGVARNSADRAYLNHNGKPLVAIWGIGFKDRWYTLDECRDMVDFFKNDPTYGGCTVMLGVPSYWRTLTGDCVSDPKLHEIIQACDVVSPWSVGRFGSKHPNQLDNYVSNVWVPDMVWCRQNDKEYLPVVFPGFSWQNLQGEQWDHIPRRGGSFLWRQIYKAVSETGATMIYQAMFDEVDEATAIFKCTGNPPTGPTPFLPTGNGVYTPYDPADAQLPSDHYLWLVGQAGRMLRGEIEITPDIPAREGPAGRP